MYDVYIPGREGDWIWQHSQEGKVNVAKDCPVDEIIIFERSADKIITFETSYKRPGNAAIFASFTTSIISNEWGLSESNRRQREKRKVY